MLENGLRKLFRIKFSCQLLGSTIKQHINMHLAFLFSFFLSYEFQI